MSSRQPLALPVEVRRAWLLLLRAAKGKQEVQKRMCLLTFTLKFKTLEEKQQRGSMGFPPRRQVLSAHPPFTASQFQGLKLFLWVVLAPGL